MKWNEIKEEHCNGDDSHVRIRPKWANRLEILLEKPDWNQIAISNCAFTWNTLINTPLFKNSHLNKRHPKIETVSSVNDRTLPLIAAKFTKTIRKTSPNYERIHWIQTRKRQEACHYLWYYLNYFRLETKSRRILPLTYGTKYDIT